MPQNFGLLRILGIMVEMYDFKTQEVVAGAVEYYLKVCYICLCSGIFV